MGQPYLGTEIHGDPDDEDAEDFPVAPEGLSEREAQQEVGEEGASQAGDQHGEPGGERGLAATQEVRRGGRIGTISRQMTNLARSLPSSSLSVMAVMK